MNEEQKLPFELSDDEKKQIVEKCAELAKKYECADVHACVQLRDGGGEGKSNERIISYLKEPNYITKLAIMDKAAVLGTTMAADELRTMCQLQEESHPLTYGNSAECDYYKLGVTRFCIDLITYAIDVFKKK